MGNEYFKNSVTVTRSVTVPEISTSTSQAPDYYSDIDLPYYYYFPTFDFTLGFTLISLGLIAAAVQFIIFIFLAIIIIASKKNTYKCEHCGETFKIDKGVKPQYCKICGANLNPRKCP